MSDPEDVREDGRHPDRMFGFAPIPSRTAEFAPSEPVVAMVEHAGHVYVATRQRVFRLQGDTLVPLKLQL